MPSYKLLPYKHRILKCSNAVLIRKFTGKEGVYWRNGHILHVQFIVPHYMVQEISYRFGLIHYFIFFHFCVSNERHT